MTRTPVPDFEYEVFISYAHNDNRPLFEDGWITQFDRVLDILLSEFLGSEAKIWRDNMLRGDDDIKGTIHIQFPRVAIMVSILSPSYIKSDWCLWEVKKFCEIAEQFGGYWVGNKSRIYKVIKVPLDDESPPSVFSGVNGYEFFRRKDKNGTPRSFNVESDDDRKRDFLDAVGDIAYDISKLLKIIRNSNGQGSLGSARDQDEPSGSRSLANSVYLAEVAPDLARERDIIKRDLLERKYHVLPERPLPEDFNELQQMVREDLKRCCLSIHLVGQDYGNSPKGKNQSFAYWQHRLSEERLTDPDFSRLIWMPKANRYSVPGNMPSVLGNIPSDVRQDAFIKELLNADSPITSDLLQTSLEDFKTAIQDKMKSANEKSSGSGQSNDRKGIGIICDNNDLESARPLERYLRAKGYEPSLLATSGDEAQDRKDPETNLDACHAAIIFWNNAPLIWPLDKLEELLKLSQSTGLQSIVIFVCGDKTPDKDRFQAKEALVIKSFGEATMHVLDAKLQPFIAEVEGYGRSK